jgi:hypothetical protein
LQAKLLEPYDDRAVAGGQTLNRAVSRRDCVEPGASPAYFNHQTNTGFTRDTSDFCRAIALVTFETSIVAHPAYQIISKRDDVTDASTFLGRCRSNGAVACESVGDQRASLVSSGGEAAKPDDVPDTIRPQITLDADLKALRAVLYWLESGTPYGFVDALIIQPLGSVSGRAVEDPSLRTTLSLRALWRRSTS